MDEPDYYTTREAGLKLNLKGNTVRHAILAGKIRAAKFGQQWLITPREVRRVARERTRTEETRQRRRRTGRPLNLPALEE